MLLEVSLLVLCFFIFRLFEALHTDGESVAIMLPASNLASPRLTSCCAGTSSMATTGTSSGATAATPASGAGNQHMAPGLGAGAAILGLALL